MKEHSPRNLPWLDRLTARVPAYGGYQERAQRRAADRALRDAIADGLTTAKQKLDEAIRQCVAREALSQIPPLEEIRRRLDRLADRIRAAGSGIDDFYHAPDLDAAEADTLHAADLALANRVETLVADFDRPDLDHDRLAHIQSDLSALEKTLDERTLCLKGIR